MQEQSIELLLQPHAWPGAYKVGGMVSQADVSETHQKAREMAPLYTHLLGVPAVFVNHVGPRGPEKWSGLLGGMIGPEAFRFLGHSTIADSDGSILAQMDDCTEGVIVADVTLDPARRVYSEPAHYGTYGGGWVKPHSPVLDAICHVDAFFGGLSYSLSGERKRKARLISRS
jgi:predicted amidohydrolase